LVGFNGLDCTFDETGTAAEALVKAPSASHFSGAVTRKMSTPAPNEAGRIAVRAEETSPIVFTGIVTRRNCQVWDFGFGTVDHR
jgi:hypothetical protein